MFHTWVSRRRRAFEEELKRRDAQRRAKREYGGYPDVRGPSEPTTTPPADSGPPFRGGPHHRVGGGEEPGAVIADATARDRARGRLTAHRDGGPGGQGTGSAPRPWLPGEDPDAAE